MSLTNTLKRVYYATRNRNEFFAESRSRFLGKGPGAEPLKGVQKAKPPGGLAWINPRVEVKLRVVINIGVIVGVKVGLWLRLELEFDFRLR